MLNLKLGRSVAVDGRPWIVTAPDRTGFAIYGPYEMVPAGRYVVEFLAALEGGPPPPGNPACLVLDVSSEGGERRHAEVAIRRGELSGDPTAFALAFTLDAPSRLEFRAWVSGAVALRLADRPRLAPLMAEEDATDALALAHFPEAEGEVLPYFRKHRERLRALFEEGARVRIDGGRVLVRVAGIWLACETGDDLAFIGEVFGEGAYNFGTAQPVRAIDIGMNVGMSSLLFASKPEVTRVHGFEPFGSTFARAVANLALNPRLATRINARNIGLSDRDHDGELRVTPVEASGSRNVIEVAHGEPVSVTLRDAGTVLGPLIAEARAAGERVVVKVDCEGSEYAIFASLARCGLLGRIDAFMVEWHAMFEEYGRERLIEPLRDAGFLVFDRSPPRGNGFFYAVRLG